MKRLLPFALLSVIVLCFTACSKTSSAPLVTDAPPVFSHRAFDELLNAYVDENGWVDYMGLKKDRAKLDQYLATVASAQPQTFPDNAERIAFWINGYNAFVLADVLDKAYGQAKSVQDVKGFFDQKTHQIAGAELSLREIVARGRELKEPRIHFALSCAATSCPKLQRQAYIGVKLELQLTKAAREFLGDMSRGMNYNPGSNIVYLSPIFQWNASDFSDSSSSVADTRKEVSGAEMLEAAKKYMPAPVAQFLTEKKMEVKWLNFDWSLNAQDIHRIESKTAEK